MSSKGNDCTYSQGPGSVLEHGLGACIAFPVEGQMHGAGLQLVPGFVWGLNLADWCRESRRTWKSSSESRTCASSKFCENSLCMRLVPAGQGICIVLTIESSHRPRTSPVHLRSSLMPVHQHVFSFSTSAGSLNKEQIHRTKLSHKIRHEVPLWPERLTARMVMKWTPNFS